VLDGDGNLSDRNYMHAIVSAGVSTVPIFGRDDIIVGEVCHKRRYHPRLSDLMHMDSRLWA
jgi:hypothetical protein